MGRMHRKRTRLTYTPGCLPSGNLGRVTQAPAGWYPDPAPQQPGQPPLVRYWDGQVWTEHVQPAQPAQPVVPYAGASVSPGPTTPDGVPLSGWWRRVGAYVIDGLLVGVVTSVVTIPKQMQMQQDMNDLMQRFEAQVSQPGGTADFGAFFRDYMDIFLPVLTWSAIAGFLAWAIYSSLMLRFKGATLGKMVVGIAVRLRERPGQLPWSNIFLRVLVQHGVLLTAVVPLLYLVLFWFPYLDSFWPLWDRKRQAIHDKAAKTNVVVVR